MRDERISAVNQVDFAKIFGDIVIRQDYDVEQSAVTETQFVSNTREDGILGDGELAFHHDQLFQENPLKALILCGIEVPAEGGETSFVHTTRAYDAMPESVRQRLEGEPCLHLYDFNGKYTGL